MALCMVLGSGDDVTDRLGKAALGSGIGLVAGAAAPAVASGVGWAANKVAGPVISTVRGLINPLAEGERRVGGAFAADKRAGGLRMTEQEAADAAARGQPVAAIDQGGEEVLALGRSAANNSPEARTVLNEATDRTATQIDRVEAGLSDAVGGGALDDTARISQLKNQARRENGPAYRTAYNEGQGIWDGELSAFAQAPAVRQAILKAERTGANRAVADGFSPPRSPFTLDEAGNVALRVDGEGTRAVPNLQFWDHVQRNLSDAIEAAKRAGRNSEAADLSALHRQLLDKLDGMVPSFARARAGAAAHFGAQDALEAGRKFATSSMTAEQAAPIIAKMTPAEKKLFAEGYAAARRDALRRKGDNSDLGKAFLHSADDRAKAAAALGQAAAAKLEAGMYVERIMQGTKEALKGNSTTARQLIESGLAGGAMGGYSNDWDFKATAIGAAGGAVARRHAEKKVAVQIAKMLASGDPQMIKRVEQLASRSPKYMDALRSVSRGIQRIGTQEPVRSGTTPLMNALGHSGHVYADDEQSNGPGRVR
jgi:hypothetical protein